MCKFERKEACEPLCFHSKCECTGSRMLVVWGAMCGAVPAGLCGDPCNAGHSFSLKFSSA